MYSRSQRGNPWAALLIASFLMTGYSCTATSSEANAQQEPAITGTIRTSDGSPLYGILVNGNVIGKFDPTTEKFTYLLFPQPESHSRNTSLDHSTDPIGVVYERAFLAQKDFTATIGRMHIRGSNSR